VNTLATWSTKHGEIKATTDNRENGLGLAIWHNGKLAGFNFTEVEKAQTLVNRLAGEIVWKS
jgi:hypothetical protein